MAVNGRYACWRPTSPLRGGRRSKAAAQRTTQVIRVGVSSAMHEGPTPTRLCRALRANRRPPLKGEVGHLVTQRTPS